MVSPETYKIMMFGKILLVSKPKFHLWLTLNAVKKLLKRDCWKEVKPVEDLMIILMWLEKDSKLSSQKQCKW